MYDVADGWYTYNASGAAVVILFWLIAILKLPLPLSNCVTTLSASTWEALKNGIWPTILFCKLYNEPENEPVNPFVDITEPDINALPLTSKPYPTFGTDCLPTAKVPPRKFEVPLNCLTNPNPAAVRVPFILALSVAFKIPTTLTDPVIPTLPVNWCVLDSNEPFLVEPVTNSIDEVIVWATIVWAVNVPLTKKLSADDAVAEYDAVNAWDA